MVRNIIIIIIIRMLWNRIIGVLNLNKKASYRKDGRAMRGCALYRHMSAMKFFSGVPDYAHGYFSRIF